MRKYWAYAPNTQPHPRAGDNEATKASGHEHLRKLLGVWILLVIIVITVMFYRHLQDWPVVQK